MLRLLATLIFVCMMAFSYHANAATVTYSLDNIVQNNYPSYGTITGNFIWTYDPVDFEGGSGVFTDLHISDDPYPLNELKITVETKLIEITLLDNINNEGVDIQLRFANGFTEQGGDLDLINSTWSLRGGGISGVFTSGSISPTVVPIPAAIWLFGTGLIGLLFVSRRKLN